MKRKIVAFIGILLIFSILTGCSKAITEGEVISKEFTPAHTQIMFIPIVHTNGKTSYTTLVPFIYYYNDKWEEMLSATYRITEEVFDAVTIGSEFVYSNDMEPLEPEYTRERQ